jgi:hypothetical protein
MCESWCLALKVTGEFSSGPNDRDHRILLIASQNAEKIRLGVTTSADNLKGRISLKIDSTAQWLRSVLQKGTDIASFPTRPIAVDSLRVITLGREFNQFVNLVSNDRGIRRVGWEEIRISFVVGVLR